MILVNLLRNNPNKARIQLLVAALRSGEYQQTTGQLEDGDGKMCCLGVACKVAMQHGLPLSRILIAEAEQDPDYPKLFSKYPADTEYSYNESTTVLPNEAMHWYGFSEPDPKLIAPNTSKIVGATVLNDDFKCTFGEIADAFERTYITNSNEDHTTNETETTNTETTNEDHTTNETETANDDEERDS